MSHAIATLLIEKKISHAIVCSIYYDSITNNILMFSEIVKMTFEL